MGRYGVSACAKLANVSTGAMGAVTPDIMDAEYGAASISKPWTRPPSTESTDGAYSTASDGPYSAAAWQQATLGDEVPQHVRMRVEGTYGRSWRRRQLLDGRFYQQ